MEESKPTSWCHVIDGLIISPSQLSAMSKQCKQILKGLEDDSQSKEIQELDSAIAKYKENILKLKNLPEGVL